MHPTPLPFALTLLLASASAVIAVSPPSLRPIVLTARDGHVKPSKEKQDCHRVRFPRRRGMDVGRVQMFVHGGSHHVHLYRPYNGAVEYPPRRCPFAVDFDKWQLVVASQTPELDWSLPPGVAINFGPRQPLLIQTHFVNTGALVTKGIARAKIALYPIDPAAVTGGVVHAGALFAQDRTVRVPPGETTVTSRCALTGEGAEAREMTILAFTGHYHFRGRVFEVWRVRADGQREDVSLYRHEGYDDPSFLEYPPDRPLVLHPGEGLEWACTYHNEGPETFEFGPNTARNEHCNLFGFYYPTETPQEGIDCIHKLDDQGREENLRIVAH